MLGDSLKDLPVLEVPKVLHAQFPAQPVLDAIRAKLDIDDRDVDVVEYCIANKIMLVFDSSSADEEKVFDAVVFTQRLSDKKKPFLLLLDIHLNKSRGEKREDCIVEAIVKNKAAKLLELETLFASHLNVSIMYVSYSHHARSAS